MFAKPDGEPIDLDNLIQESTDIWPGRTQPRIRLHDFSHNEAPILLRAATPVTGVSNTPDQSSPHSP